MVCPSLPISNLRGAFLDALAAGSVLLEAEPGAGKSTLAPLWTLAAAAAGEVWLVQPRVLAATSLAARLARLLDETVGQQVGYQVPFDTRKAQQTRLLVMTPGVLLQRLLANPGLEGVACVMLDEIHERSVDQDTAWAWLQEAAILNDSLSLVLMSATPDAAVKRQVDTPLFSPGRCFPVSLRYCPAQSSARRREPVATHLLRALAGQPGWRDQTTLVFLPGWRAIQQCRRELQKTFPQVAVFCLHSRIDRAEQAAALDPGQGARVILATNIAETSLTIADVTLVVDSGLVREAQFEQRAGVTRLQTHRVSLASAEQRRGRAGRVRPGCCIRLWAESEALATHTLPEIRRCDYLPLTLRLAHWGTEPTQLPWLEPPNPQALVHARAHLRRWRFVDDKGVITALGRQVARLGTHPRIAALLLHVGREIADHPWLLLVALALHFDLPAEGDLAQWLQQAAITYDSNKKWRKLAGRWQKVLAIRATPCTQHTPLPAALTDQLTVVLADRLGRRTGSGRYRLDAGISVNLETDSDWALVLQVGRRGQEQAGVGIAVTPDKARIRELAVARRMVEIAGSGKRRHWVERTDYCLGGQRVDTQQRQLTSSEVPAAIVAQVQKQGLDQIAWPQTALALLLRARWAAKLERLALPALELAQLSARLDVWLAPFLDGHSDLAQLPLEQALTFYLGRENRRRLDELVPKNVTLPSGRATRVNYAAATDTAALLAGRELPVPVVSAKLQEFFGTECYSPLATPLSLELLSPAGQPLAITRDLAYFWRAVYPDVRREMRGRYNKHPWPQDPLAHTATALTNRRLRQ